MKASVRPVLNVMPRALPLTLLLLAACSAPPPRRPGPSDISLVDMQALRGATQMYREYAAALLKIDAPNSRDVEAAILELEKLHPFGIFADERGGPGPGLIDAARQRPEARAELARRGRMYTGTLTFWQPFDRQAWNTARRRIVESSVNRDGEFYLSSVFCMMMINGQYRPLWPEIRFQLVELGKPAIPIVIGVAEQKAAATPDTVIYSEDDLVQLIATLITFGDQRWDEGPRESWSRSGIEAARSFATHERRNVRKAVARAIGEVRADILLPELAALLRERSTPDSWMVRASAAEALEKFDGARNRVAPLLEEALKAETSSTVVVRILRSMGACHHPDLVPTLMKAVDSTNYDWSQEAMSALYHITGEKGLVTPPHWHEWYKTSYPAWRKRAK